LRVRVAGAPADAELAVGDAIHNLRTALDLAVVEAVQFGGGSGNATHFPLCENADAIEDTIRWRKLHRASAEVQDLIRSLRPYKGGNDALRGLHDLDIRDKHRTLIEVAANVTTPVLRAVMTDGKPRIEMDPTTEPKAVFTFSRNSPFDGKPLVETLRDLGRQVLEIVDSIAAACKKDEVAMSDTDDGGTARLARINASLAAHGHPPRIAEQQARLDEFRRKIGLAWWPA
jgi:hypothetical protein